LARATPLGETSPKRRRGSHGTSADAFCVLERTDGGRTGILIEWKYTESYFDELRKHGEFYRPLLEAPDSPIDVEPCGGVDGLFIDPLYQLARLQLLAQAMERAGAADRMIVLLVVPEGNVDYLGHLPGEALRARYLGLAIDQVWPLLLRQPDRFVRTSFDSLLRSFMGEVEGLRDVSARYGRG
jgi:hypothetical protein